MYINLQFCSYEILSEAIDKMTDISVHLCQVMSIPPRDHLEGSGSSNKSTVLEDTYSSSSSSSPGAWNVLHGA